MASKKLINLFLSNLVKILYAYLEIDTWSQQYLNYLIVFNLIYLIYNYYLNTFEIDAYIITISNFNLFKSYLKQLD